MDQERTCSACLHSWHYFFCAECPIGSWCGEPTPPTTDSYDRNIAQLEAEIQRLRSLKVPRRH